MPLFFLYCKDVRIIWILQVGTYMSDTYEDVTIAVHEQVTDKNFLKKVSCCLKEINLPL